MTNQPPLIDQTGASLPGPQFTPRPGWGGQLRRWLSHNGALLVFRVVILAALILIGRSLWIRLPARDANLATQATPTPDSDAIALLAQPGDGISDLAARALDLFVVASEDATLGLDAAQHLYAVSTLSTAHDRRALNVGEVISFTNSELLDSIRTAQLLTPAQKAAWTRLLTR